MPEARLPPLFVSGLSGQLGEALCRLGLPMPALALTRQADHRPDVADVRWVKGDLASVAAASAFDVALSLGPLDAFADAVAAGRVRAGRYIAFGSTSLHAKANSPDPAERALARRLADAEARLGEAARRQGAACLILRPTLIWGLGRDATVSRVVALARRWPLLPLPVSAPGLRMPVHALDLAALARDAVLRAHPAVGAFDLPGAETLPFGTMLARAVAVGAPHGRVLPMPWRWVRAVGRHVPATRGWVARLGADLVFDPSPAREALGWAPRGFSPAPPDFPSR